MILKKISLKETSLKAADTIHPCQKNQLTALRQHLKGAWNGCLSRQRTWGVPIPALLCSNAIIPIALRNLINQVAKEVAKKGIEYWDDATVQELLPKDFKCPDCGSNQFKKEYDILDVWFESGVSHYAVLYNNPMQAFPADMYLEGKDQHRGMVPKFIAHRHGD